MQHQLTALDQMDGRAYFALLMEQGTGKTLVFLENSLREYSRGAIDGVLVVAPNGVQINWVLEEIPRHVPETVALKAAYWTASTRKAERAALEELFEPRRNGDVPTFRVLAMNIEAVSTDRGYKFAERFLLSGRIALIVDESHRIKNTRASCTKRLTKLGRLAKQRFIGTGTPITNTPVDAFSQFQFLKDGLLGTSSETTFRADYCELLPPGHGLMRHIQKRLEAKYGKDQAAHFQPQVIARDEFGRPKYRNLERLQQLIVPHSYRVLKSECLDIPDKVYQTRFFELSAEQRRMYDALDKELRLEFGDGWIEPIKALNAGVRLQQITSGYVSTPMLGLKRIIKDNPRIQLLLDTLEDVEGQVIIWARFIQELKDISATLKGTSHALLYGETKPRERAEIVRDFQEGKLRIIVGQPQVGGTGITLHAATTVIYFSNDFNLSTRLQSEDRAHRIGQKRSVNYIDLIAVGTVDQRIVSALQRKEDVAAAIVGDFQKHRRERKSVLAADSGERQKAK